MRIILDTGILWRPAVLRRLAATAYDVVVPAVVFVERARQVLRDGGTVDDLIGVLRRNQFEVEPFGMTQGLRYAVGIADDGRWKRLARDALIAGHVGRNDVLMTTNPKDFLAIGLPEDAVVGTP